MADPTIFDYQILDDQGLTNRSSLYVAYDGATETVDSIIGGWLAYGGLLNTIIDGQIVGGRVTIPLEPDGSWKATPAVGNNANQVMALNFGNDFNRYHTPVLIPSYKENTLTATRLPDLADAGLAAFIAAVIAGTGGVIFPNSRDLHDLDALLDAFLTVRKVRNQRTRTRVRP